MMRLAPRSRRPRAHRDVISQLDTAPQKQAQNPEPNSARQEIRPCFFRYAGTRAIAPIEADPSRNNGSNFSEMLTRDANPEKESKTGPATRCTKHTAAINYAHCDRHESCGGSCSAPSLSANLSRFNGGPVSPTEIWLRVGAASKQDKRQEK